VKTESEKIALQRRNSKKIQKVELRCSNSKNPILQKYTTNIRLQFFEAWIETFPIARGSFGACASPPLAYLHALTLLALSLCACMFTPHHLFCPRVRWCFRSCFRSRAFQPHPLLVGGLFPVSPFLSCPFLLCLSTFLPSLSLYAMHKSCDA